MNSQISNKPEGNYDYVAKAILVGDSSVGKSNLLSRFIANEFSNENKPTLGVEFGTKILQTREKLVKIQIWDTAGQEKYKSITNSYYVNSKGAIVVFDLSRKSSFDNTDKWIKDVLEITGKEISLILVGNKTDLTDNRVIEYNESLEKAKKYNIQYKETSALNGENVKEVFQILTDSIYDNFLSKINLDDEDEYKNSNVLLKTQVNKDDNCKC